MSSSIRQVWRLCPIRPSPPWVRVAISVTVAAIAVVPVAAAGATTGAAVEAGIAVALEAAVATAGPGATTNGPSPDL